MPGRPVAGPGDRAVLPGCPGVSGWQAASGCVSSGGGTSVRSRPAPGSSFRRCKTSPRNPSLGKTTGAKPLGPYPAQFHGRLRILGGVAAALGSGLCWGGSCLCGARENGQNGLEGSSLTQWETPSIWRASNCIRQVIMGATGWRPVCRGPVSAIARRCPVCIRGRAIPQSLVAGGERPWRAPIQPFQ